MYVCEVCASVNGCVCASLCEYVSVTRGSHNEQRLIKIKNQIILLQLVTFDFHDSVSYKYF